LPPIDYTPGPPTPRTVHDQPQREQCVLADVALAVDDGLLAALEAAVPPTPLGVDGRVPQQVAGAA
jgi:hypothetical protein